MRPSKLGSGEDSNEIIPTQNHKTFIPTICSIFEVESTLLFKRMKYRVWHLNLSRIQNLTRHSRSTTPKNPISTVCSTRFHLKIMQIISWCSKSQSLPFPSYGGGGTFWRSELVLFITDKVFKKTGGGGKTNTRYEYIIPFFFYLIRLPIHHIDIVTLYRIL